MAYDESGRVVGVKRWEGAGVQPGGVSPFEMTVASLGGRMARVEFAVEARPSPLERRQSMVCRPRY
ncbi:MAG: hypothetical protein MZV64_19755 [Ignavibacteriales bacterium]|nr:hypothetical protein [Ignavibacteriales bacterium]